MPYNTNDLYNPLVRVTRLAIGDRLHQFPDGLGGTKAAVFKIRAAGQAEGKLHGILPYCVISSNSRDRQGSSVNSRSWDINDDQVLTTIWDHSISMLIVGGDAEGIAYDLEAFFSSDAAIEYLCDNNIAVVNTYGVRPSTTNLDSVPYDSALLNIKVTTTTELIQQVYEVITAEGDLHIRYPDSEDDIISSPLNAP